MRAGLWFCEPRTELRPLVLEAEAELRRRVEAIRASLLRCFAHCTHPRDADEVGALLATHRGVWQTPRLASLQGDWDALQRHYEALVVRGKAELRELASSHDAQLLVRERLGAFCAWGYRGRPSCLSTDGICSFWERKKNKKRAEYEWSCV